jgi:DNA polymerase-4
VRIRRLGLACDRLVFPPAQLSLFAEEQQPAEKRDRIVSALDAVRRRFGREAVQVGRTLAASDAS